MKRTNIMLGDDQHTMLKGYARREGKTLGELVRVAVDVMYNKRDSLEQRKSVALNAYREGLISLGKLSEILGIDVVSARMYLKRHRIPVRGQGLEDIVQDLHNA